MWDGDWRDWTEELHVDYTLYGKTESVISDIEEIDEDLTVNLKVAGLSLGSIDTTITVQLYRDD